MRSFSSYNSGLPTHTVYLRIQMVMNKVFRTLIDEGRCNRSVPTLFITVDDSNIDQIIGRIQDNDKPVLPIMVLINGNHATGLLFSRDDRRFTFFDPDFHTDTMELMAPIFRQLSERTGYRYYPIPWIASLPSRFAPCYIAIQELTDDMYCCVWVLLVMYLVCNEGLTISQVVTQLNNYSVQSLTDEITGFIHFVYLEMSKHGLADEAIAVAQLVATAIDDKLMDILISNPEPYDYLIEQGVMTPVRINEHNTDLYLYLAPYLDDIQRSFIVKLGYPMDDEEFVAGCGLLYTYNNGIYVPEMIVGEVAQAYPAIVRSNKQLLTHMSIALEQDFDRFQQLMEDLRRLTAQRYAFPDSHKLWHFVVEFLIRLIVPSYHKLRNTNSIEGVIDGRMSYYTSLLDNELYAFYLTFNPVPFYNPNTVIDSLKRGVDFIQASLDASYIRCCLQRY